MTNFENFENNVQENLEPKDKVQEPAAVLVLDKDGEPVNVKVLGPNEVQDIEYSEDPNGN